MADGGEAVSVRVIERIGDLPAADWDRCAGAGNPSCRTPSCTRWN